MFPHLPSSVLLTVLISSNGAPGHDGDAQERPSGGDDEADREDGEAGTEHNEWGWACRVPRGPHGGSGDDTIHQRGFLRRQRRREPLLVRVESEQSDVWGE